MKLTDRSTAPRNDNPLIETDSPGDTLENCLSLLAFLKHHRQGQFEVGAGERAQQGEFLIYRTLASALESLEPMLKEVSHG